MMFKKKDVVSPESLTKPECAPDDTSVTDAAKSAAAAGASNSASASEGSKSAADSVAAKSAKAVMSHGYALSAAVGSAAHEHVRLVSSDLLQAVKTNRTVQLMLAGLVVALVCWNLYPIAYVLYPFKLFVTVIHEFCHALAARLTGGNVALISIAADESGLTASLGGFRPLVVMAGYVGTAIFGGLLIWLGRNPSAARSVLQSIGTVVVALALFYGAGWFSLFWMFAIGAGILVVSKKASELHCHMFLLMLAVMTGLEAVLSIQDLFIVSTFADAKSDAHSMEGLTGIPAPVWSIVWGIFAVAILLFSLWYSYKPERSESEEAATKPMAPGDATTTPTSEATSGAADAATDVSTALSTGKLEPLQVPVEAEKQEA